MTYQKNCAIKPSTIKTTYRFGLEHENHLDRYEDFETDLESEGGSDYICYI